MEYDFTFVFLGFNMKLFNFYRDVQLLLRPINEFRIYRYEMVMKE